MRLLKDPVWQFVGAVVGLLAVGVPVILYFKTRPVKELRVEILSNSPLVSINTDVAKDMRVLYRDKQVQSLSLILLRLANTGTEPIRESDYSEPIRISLSDSAGVGEVVIQETRPEGILFAPTITGTNTVELARVLLNPGDQAVLKILALNNDSTLRITARIAGIRNLAIQSVLERSDPRDTNNRAAYVAVAVGILLVVCILVWWSRAVMEWRRSRFGFDPPRHFYIRAQEAMLNGLSKENTIQNVMGLLERTLTWDVGYLQRMESDPLFAPIRGYERYKALVEKFSGLPPQANSQP